MFAHTDPVLQTALLATQLRRLRGRAGLTQREVAQQHEWSTNKVIRIEAGASRISITDLNALLALYQLTDQEQAEQLRDLARGSRGRHWTHDYRDHLSEPARRYLAYEKAARRVLVASSSVLPSLLQIEPYGRATLAVSTPGIADQQVAVQLRIQRARQDAMFTGPHPHLLFLLDELALRYPVGGIEVMTAQLEHLRVMAARHEVSIQVLPVDLGIPLAPFTVLDFEDTELPSMLMFQTPHQTLLSTDDVDTCRRRFERLQQLATSTDAFATIIDDAIDRLCDSPISPIGNRRKRP